MNAPRTQRRGLGRGLGSLIPTQAPEAEAAGRRPGRALEPGRPPPAPQGPRPSTRQCRWRPWTGRASPSSRSTRSGRTPSSRARSSTRRRWPSWSTRSARWGCSSPSSSAGSTATSYELVMGERRWRATQAAGLDHHPGDHPRHRRHRHAARRAAGEPAPVPAQPAGGGLGLRTAARGLRVHPRGAGPAGSVGPARRSATRSGCSSSARPSSGGSPPAYSRPATPGPCWPSRTRSARTGWPSG